MTPDELAHELGYSGKTFRHWLRTYRPRPESEKWSRWDLTPDDEAALRRNFATRATVSRLHRGFDLRPVVHSVDLEPQWDWEGNIQHRMASYLESRGWVIQALADTARREHGDDIRARQPGRTLRVEVKGWPTKGRYADPRRPGEVKRTQPSTQAAHWYSQALLRVMRDMTAHPHDEVAVALPDRPRFRALVAATHVALHRLHVGIYLICEDGTVDEALAHNPSLARKRTDDGGPSGTRRGVEAGGVHEAPKSGKYAPLAQRLALVGHPVELSFSDIAALVGGLPRSAYVYRAWWANDPAHVEARAWLGTGRRVEEVDKSRQRVRFS